MYIYLKAHEKEREYARVSTFHSASLDKRANDYVFKFCRGGRRASKRSSNERHRLNAISSACGARCIFVERGCVTAACPDRNTRRLLEFTSNE